MKYATAITLAAVLASATYASPIAKRQDNSIVCQSTPVDQLWTATLKDLKAADHPQAKAAGLVASSRNGVHVNTVATEGLIGVDDNKVFYELYQDPVDRAAHFYVQQCNSTLLNANQDTLNGDLPVRLISKDDPSLCASAINVQAGESTSTPIQLLPCDPDDRTDDTTTSQFWAQTTSDLRIRFIGNVQDGSNNYWYSETGGGDSFRTPNVMKNACPDDDQGCKDGAIDFQLIWDEQH